MQAVPAMQASSTGRESSTTTAGFLNTDWNPRDVPAGTKVALGLLRGKQKLEVSIAALALTPERAQQIFENRSGLALAELDRIIEEAGSDTISAFFCIPKLPASGMSMPS